MISLSYYAIEKDGRTIKIRTMSVNRNVLMFFLLYCVSFYLQSTLSYIKKTSSLEAYIEWFNRLGYLVATEVCLVSGSTNMHLPH